jgi:hypothetical protein
MIGGCGSNVNQECTGCPWRSRFLSGRPSGFAKLQRTILGGIWRKRRNTTSDRPGQACCRRLLLPVLNYLLPRPQQALSKHTLAQEPRRACGRHGSGAGGHQHVLRDAAAQPHRHAVVPQARAGEPGPQAPPRLRGAAKQCGCAGPAAEGAGGARERAGCACGRLQRATPAGNSSGQLRRATPAGSSGGLRRGF